MGKLLHIIPVSELRQNTAKVLKRVRDSGEPIVITQRGRAAAILLSVEALEQSERDRELLRLLAKGEKEIEAGEGRDLNSILAEADALLSEEQSRKSALPLLPGFSFSLRSPAFVGTAIRQHSISVNGPMPYHGNSKNSRTR